MCRIRIVVPPHGSRFHSRRSFHPNLDRCAAVKWIFLRKSQLVIVKFGDRVRLVVWLWLLSSLLLSSLLLSLFLWFSQFRTVLVVWFLFSISWRLQCRLRFSCTGTVVHLPREKSGREPHCREEHSSQPAIWFDFFHGGQHDTAYGSKEFFTSKQTS